MLYRYDTLYTSTVHYIASLPLVCMSEVAQGTDKNSKARDHQHQTKIIVYTAMTIYCLAYMPDFDATQRQYCEICEIPLRMLHSILNIIWEEHMLDIEELKQLEYREYSH